MAMNTELGVTAVKIYYGEVGNNLLPFALSLSPVFCKVKSIFPDILGENLTQQSNFPAFQIEDFGNGGTKQNK